MVRVTVPCTRRVWPRRGPAPPATECARVPSPTGTMLAGPGAQPEKAPGPRPRCNAPLNAESDRATVVARACPRRFGFNRPRRPRPGGLGGWAGRTGPPFFLFLESIIYRLRNTLKGNRPSWSFDPGPAPLFSCQLKGRSTALNFRVVRSSPPIHRRSQIPQEAPPRPVWSSLTECHQWPCHWQYNVQGRTVTETVTVTVTVTPLPTRRLGLTLATRRRTWRDRRHGHVAHDIRESRAWQLRNLS